jgi:hypothetical protein
MAGRDLAEYRMKTFSFLTERGYPFTPTAKREIARDVKRTTLLQCT